MPIPVFASARVLVTGAAGFIGSHLVDSLLKRGASVRALDDFSTGSRDNLSHCIGRIDLIEADIRNAGRCQEACEGVDFVFHEAALGSVPRSLRDPATTLEVNVSGTANVLAAARQAGVRRVIYASSSSVYGDSEQLPRREGEEGRPLSPYALSKSMTEELADVFARCYGMALIGLRYFNVYGPRQAPEGPYAAVIPRFLKACVAGEAPLIYGDGEQSRDFTYVADAVAANLLAAGASDDACGRAYNVGSGVRTTVRELAARIGEITGCSREPQTAEARPGDVPHSVADVTRARAFLDYQPAFSLARGLAEAYPRFVARMSAPGALSAEA